MAEFDQELHDAQVAEMHRQLARYEAFDGQITLAEAKSEWQADENEAQG